MQAKAVALWFQATGVSAVVKSMRVVEWASGYSLTHVGEMKTITKKENEEIPVASLKLSVTPR